jgi:Ulp1 family protease
MNADATLFGRYNYEKRFKWIKKAPGNNIFNLKNIYFIINIDNYHWACIVVYMEEKWIQYYNSLKNFGKDDKYLKGTLQYVYDLDKK